MQDFTKPVTTNTNPLNHAKQGKWLNKDRLWNFVFWFGMSSGFSVATFFRLTLRMPNLFPVIAWSTLILVPLMVTLANRTRFIQKDTFANNEGTILSKKQMPYMFPLAIMSGFGFSFIVAETFFPKGSLNIIIHFIFFSCLFSGLSLYFIFKNCPISILFNYKFWTLELHPGSRVSSPSNSYTNSFCSSSRTPAIDYYTNPTYGGLKGNIYNKYR